MIRLERFSSINNTELLPILSDTQHGDQQGNDDSRVVTKKWSMVYWLMLKFMCVFHGKDVVSTRKCLRCRLSCLEREKDCKTLAMPLPNYLYPSAIGSPAGWSGGDTEGNNRCRTVKYSDGPEWVTNNNGEILGEHIDKCPVCCSMWSNANGQDVRYSETEIGASWLNHRGSMPLSLVLQTTCIAFLAYDGFTYLGQFWGDRTQLMRLLSYSSYLLSISAPPILCILANLRNIFPRTRVSCFSWTTALHPQYIIKRLQYLRPESGAVWKSFLVICLTWPLFNSIYRACIYIFVAHRTPNTHVSITLVTNGIAALYWGCFCYLLFLFRLSIRTQLKLDVSFLRRHVGKQDICRTRLAMSLDEYGSLCNLCAIWMIFTISMNAVGLVTHTGWNYMYIDRVNPKTDPTKFHVNFLIWAELLMFLTLPMIAVGGLDLRHVRNDFLTQIYAIRCDKYYEFWQRVIKFIRNEFNPVTHAVKLTLLFSVITLYISLKVEDQEADYWARQSQDAKDIKPLP